MYLDQNEVDQEARAKARPEKWLEQLQTTKVTKKPAVGQREDPEPDTAETRLHIHTHLVFLRTTSTEPTRRTMAPVASLAAASKSSDCS